MQAERWLVSAEVGAATPGVGLFLRGGVEACWTTQQSQFVGLCSVCLSEERGEHLCCCYPVLCSIYLFILHRPLRDWGLVAVLGLQGADVLLRLRNETPPSSPTLQKNHLEKIALFLSCVADLWLKCGHKLFLHCPPTLLPHRTTPHPTTRSRARGPFGRFCRHVWQEWPRAPHGCWLHPVRVAVAVASLAACVYVCACALCVFLHMHDGF